MTSNGRMGVDNYRCSTPRSAARYTANRFVARVYVHALCEVFGYRTINDDAIVIKRDRVAGIGRDIVENTVCRSHAS